MKILFLFLVLVGGLLSASSVSAQQRTSTVEELGLATVQRQIRLVASPRAPTFYRGFELTSVSQPDEMGYQPLNALVVNGKKRAIKTEFINLVTDLGGLRQAFAPRDPVNKAIVYVGTNHSILAEGGQTGVFIVWKYNMDTGAYARLYSLRYDKNDAPRGYEILGNEGTKLVVIKDIDVPHCERDIPTTFSQHLRSLDMRVPTRGFVVFSPSVGMRSVYEALPRCARWIQEGEVSSVYVNTIAGVIEHSRSATTIMIEGRVYGNPNLANTRIEIYRHSTGTVPGLNTESQSQLIKTCYAAEACQLLDTTSTVYANVRYQSIFIQADGERMTSPMTDPTMAM